MTVHCILSDGSEETYHIDRRKVILSKDTYVYTYSGQHIPAIELTIGRHKIITTDSKAKILEWLSEK